MTYVVYCDLLFFFNCLMDSLLLYGAAKFSSTPFFLLRLLGAGCIGGIYGALAVLPSFAFLTAAPVVLLFPWLLLFLAFGRLSREKGVRLLIYYYLLVFAANGAGNAGKTFLQNFGVPTERLIVWVCPALLIVFLSRFSIKYLKKIMAEDGCLVRGRLTFGAAAVGLDVFLDTGNSLCEPISGYPVMVAEYEAVCGMLPKELCEEYAKCKNEQTDIFCLYDLLGTKYADADWFGRLSLVSFRSVGKKQGFLLGFRPDDFLVKGKTAVVVVALSDDKLGGRRNFNAILNPWVLDTPTDNEKSKGRKNIRDTNGKIKKRLVG